MRGAGRNGASLALRCARNVYEAIDRRAPEAGGLASWLSENAAAFGLSDEAIPDDGDRFGSSRSAAASRCRTGARSARRWRKPKQACRTGGCSDRSLARGDCRDLALDPLEADILGFALHYKLDKRVERLFDTLSECRGGTEPVPPGRCTDRAVAASAHRGGRVAAYGRTRSCWRAACCSLSATGGWNVLERLTVADSGGTFSPAADSVRPVARRR